MSKILDRNLLERVATRNGFDPESLLQVIQRFEVLNPSLRKQAILRAIHTNYLVKLVKSFPQKAFA